MTSREEEDAWREIVDNYGERPQLPEDPPPTVAAPRAAPTTPTVPPPPTAPAAPSPPAYDEVAEVEDEGRFVPPDPPPVPRPRTPRLMAWLGVLGVPVLLVVSMLATIQLPPSVTSLLVVWFLGGFLYLVSQMPRTRDDPWDDGAVL